MSTCNNPYEDERVEESVLLSECETCPPCDCDNQCCETEASDCIISHPIQPDPCFIWKTIEKSPSRLFHQLDLYFAENPLDFEHYLNQYLCTINPDNVNNSLNCYLEKFLNSRTVYGGLYQPSCNLITSGNTPKSISYSKIMPYYNINVLASKMNIQKSGYYEIYYSLNLNPVNIHCANEVIWYTGVSVNNRVIDEFTRTTGTNADNRYYEVTAGGFVYLNYGDCIDTVIWSNIPKMQIYLPYGSVSVKKIDNSLVI